MDFQIGKPVSDMHPGTLQIACQQNIVLFVKPRFQLNDRCDGFTTLGRLDQCPDNRRIRCRAVECLADGQHIWIPRCLLQKPNNNFETLIGVVNNNILVANGGKAIPIKVTDALWETGVECGIEQMLRHVADQLGKIIQRHRSICAETPVLFDRHRLAEKIER